MAITQRWVDMHDELSIKNGEIKHNGSHIGSVNDDRVSLGHDDGGVRGEAISIDDEWLIVKGTQSVNHGPERGRVAHTGRFAVRPHNEIKPEIDGPLP